jgi:hypothetical protein
MMPPRALFRTSPLRSVVVRRLVLLALVALGVAACGGSAPTIPQSALSRLVLAPGDVKPLVQFDVGPQVKLDNLAGPRKDPTRFGREGGWKARYRRSGSARTRGPLVVESRADLFKSASGAKKDLAAYEADFRQTIAPAGGDARFLTPPPRVGDDAAAITILQPGAAGAGVRFYRIAWRDHNATASVLVEGFDRKLDFATALRLARRQEARLRAAVA